MSVNKKITKQAHVNKVVFDGAIIQNIKEDLETPVTHHPPICSLLQPMEDGVISSRVECVNEEGENKDWCDENIKSLGYVKEIAKLSEENVKLNNALNNKIVELDSAIIAGDNMNHILDRTNANVRIVLHKAFGEISKRDGTIASLGNEINNRDGTIASLGNEINDRDCTIASLGNEINDRDCTIASLENEVKEKTCLSPSIMSHQIASEIVKVDLENLFDTCLRIGDMTPLFAELCR